MATAVSQILIHNPHRYSLVLGEEDVHLKCNVCPDPWVFAFKAQALSKVLDALMRHEIDSH